MANVEYLKILQQGSDAWNLWRAESNTINPDLSFADLSFANLEKANLKDANLEGSDLSYAQLRGADLREAFFRNAELVSSNLSGADLRRAKLRLTKLNYADLSLANLTGARMILADLSHAILANTSLVNASLHAAKFINADLRGANFRGANLKDADLNISTMGFTVFCDNDLSQVQGLDTVEHTAPSFISIDTIYLSKGNISETFLRGAGIPNNFLVYMKSLTGKAFDFYSCFISYSSKDQSFAERLYTDLQSDGVRCWYAPENLKIGDRIRPKIDESIQIHDKLLLVLSENSVASQWVEQEVETALAKEREQGRTVLFPIRLDDTVIRINSGWPALINNTRHIGDFTGWESYSKYRNAFERLLRDLQTEDLS